MGYIKNTAMYFGELLRIAMNERQSVKFFAVSQVTYQTVGLPPQYHEKKLESTRTTILASGGACLSQPSIDRRYQCATTLELHTKHSAPSLRLVVSIADVDRLQGGDNRGII